ncbi:MAG: alpha-2-macroglobulin [Mangrovibacterium sp.]
MKRTIQLLIGFLFIFFLFSCRDQKGKQAELLDLVYSRFVSSYTSGVISCKSPIQVELALEPGQAVKSGSDMAGKVISLQPEVAGKVQWINSNTLAFIPKESMKPGTSYTVRVALDQVLDVPEKYATMEFQVKTISQSFYVADLAIKAYDYEELEKQYLSGTVYTADYAENTAVESVVKVHERRRSLSLQWEHDASGTKHTFRVDSLVRNDQSRELTVSWDGKPLGEDKEGQQKIELPSVNDFKVVNVNVIQQPEQVLLIRFSDPLQHDQELNGLVTIDRSYDFRYLIEYNELKVYLPAQLTGEHELYISGGIKNSQYRWLKEAVLMQVRFEDLRPAIRLVGKGSIIPSSEELIVPFEAVNLKAVDLRVIKILTHNVHQFFQQNSYQEESGLKQVGRLLLQKRIDLQVSSFSALKNWNTYSIDLARLVDIEPGAIYRIQLRFRKEYSLYGKDRAEDAGRTSLIDQMEESEELKREKESWDEPGWYSDYYYPDNFNWDKRNDPEDVSYYYSDRFVSRNLFATNLVIIAKGGNSLAMNFAVTNLKTTEPEAKVTLKIYDFQKQLLETVTTGSDGLASVQLKNKPFLLIAEKDGQLAYLKLDDGSSLSLSNFNVSGEVVQRGIKGYIYGERGVWRPGDRIYLTFILEDEQDQLPADHPVIFELINPKGQVVSRQVKAGGQDGFYCFTAETAADAPTGNWNALIKIGGQTFSKRIKVETVKPNRLKMDLQFGTEGGVLVQGPVSGKLIAAWLHGGIAQNLKARVSVNFSKSKTAFTGYANYLFDDPARDFSVEEKQVFDGRTNSQGIADIGFDMPKMPSAPGMLNAHFTTRVFEETGDFSIDVKTIPYAPFNSFVGIKLPASESNWYKTNTSYPLDIVTVDAKGNKTDRKGLEVTIYKVDWRWWWDAGEENLARYVNNKYQKPVFRRIVNTTAGMARIPVQITHTNWRDNGRYLIYVKDPESGHSTGLTAYFSEWGYWASEGMQEAATMLTMKADKEKYQVGEKVTVSIPSGKKGKALVSLENGSQVLDLFWVDTKEQNTVFSFELKPEMAPNIYVHVSLIQPHEQTENDAPVRLYGVIPVDVEDPSTYLEPQIKMPSELVPEKEYEITVSERSGKEMTYTLAVVDEGLLDLTRFQTPDPWSAFYAHEALGVRTWDFYDDVIGAYGARLEKAFAVGGDESLVAARRRKVSRFEPVVRFIGPFTLDKKKSRTHRLDMPNYVGAVRVMVVAGHEGAYGKAEQSVKVQKPLMVLATLPRVLGPGEEVKLPVNVFALKPEVKDVQVAITGNELLSVVGAGSKQVSFSGTGDQLVDFGLKVAEKTGIGQVKITAKSGNHTASQEIELEVRHSNPRITNIREGIIQAKGTWDMTIQAPGMTGTNTARLELSEIPPLNLNQRLNELIYYPHGCIEQVVSGAFPQLMLNRLTEITPDRKQAVEGYVRAALSRLSRFQLSDGGFGYWPGSRYSSAWGTSYAGHFMLLAEEAGYTLPYGLKDKWLSFQKDAVRNWRGGSSSYERSDLIQSYRLYTLALARQPELGAMNRLREEKDLSLTARWRLAAAYALAGRPEVAKNMINRLDKEVAPYRELSGTYGSDLRDKAMIVETLVLLDRKTDAFPLVVELSKHLASDEWMSTQTAAYSLLAVAQFAGGGYPGQGQLSAGVSVNKSGMETVTTQKVVWQRDLPLQKDQKVSVKVENKTDKLIYARLISDGIPVTGDTTSLQSNLLMDVHYTDMQGERIDPGSIKQGTDFVAEISVHNPGQRGIYEEMALTSIFPSGWEILNSRVNDVESPLKSDAFTYQDVRDDRVNTYFDLKPGERKTFRVLLNAAYEGRFYLPSVQCGAMYDNLIQARHPGKWIEVVR